MEKFKLIIKTLLVLITAFFVIKCIYVFATNKAINEHKDTGTIISKSSDEVAIKHGSQTELYLNVQFDHSGFRAMCVEPTTYFKFKKGQRITFTLKDNTKESKSPYFILGAGLTIIISVIALIVLVVWAFNVNVE